MPGAVLGEERFKSRVLLRFLDFSYLCYLRQSLGLKQLFESNCLRSLQGECFFGLNCCLLFVRGHKVASSKSLG